MTETGTEEDWERQLVRMGSLENEDEPHQSGRPCANHAESEASFQCAGCSRLLCDACTEEKSIGGETSRFCLECGGACNSLEELKQAPSIESLDDKDKAAKAKAAARSLPPEPPPVDRQLGRVFFFPFRGLGTVVVLLWVVLVWAAWPLGFVLLLPYLAQLYARVEEARDRIPAPWHVGGGVGYVSRFLAKLVITPGLPLALCYVLLLPGSELPFSAIGETSIATTAMKAHPAGAGAAVCVFALMPLAIILLLRTGSPFTSLDPIVLWSILKRGFGRYVSLLFSMLVLAALSFAVFLAMKQTPVGDVSVPVISLIAPPPLCVALPGAVLFLWWTVIMALHGSWIGWMLGEESEEGVAKK
jgi:hypothetical protein